MSNTSKKMVVGSIAVAGLVALMSIVDLAVGVPFNRNVLMDVMFILGAGMVGYLGYDAYQDLS